MAKILALGLLVFMFVIIIAVQLASTNLSVNNSSEGIFSTSRCVAGNEFSCTVSSSTSNNNTIVNIALGSVRAIEENSTLISNITLNGNKFEDIRCNIQENNNRIVFSCDLEDFDFGEEIFQINIFFNYRPTKEDLRSSRVILFGSRA